MEVRNKRRKYEYYLLVYFVFRCVVDKNMRVLSFNNNFFPNEFLKICERLQSGHQKHFSSTVDMLITMTGHPTEREREREREREKMVIINSISQIF